jgi:hypothetical protein
MATKKKTPTAKKAAKKAAPKKAATRKSAPKKTKATRSKATHPKAAGPREIAAANAALKLVDEAAALLRKGIRVSANTSEKSRHEAKKKAHDLLSKASSSLGDLLSGGTSALRSVINKI